MEWTRNWAAFGWTRLGAGFGTRELLYAVLGGHALGQFWHARFPRFWVDTQDVCGFGWTHGFLRFWVDKWSHTFAALHQRTLEAPSRGLTAHADCHLLCLASLGKELSLAAVDGLSVRFCLGRSKICWAFCLVCDGVPAVQAKYIGQLGPAICTYPCRIVRGKQTVGIGGSRSEELS